MLINAPELLAVIQRIEKRGTLETAHRVMAICGQVFRYAIATGRAQRDPSADLKGALPAHRVTHLASITDPVKIGKLMRDIDGYSGAFVTRCAFKLAPLVFLRPVELSRAEWAEIDLDKAEWRIHADKMKMKAYLPERRRMMQHWADYLDGLKAGAEVIPLHKKAG